MFTRAVRLTSVRGVEVRLDVSLLPFALLVGWFFASRFGEANDIATSVTMAAAAFVLFFASILVHELAHALEARHRGQDVQRITLFMLGGVTEMHGGSRTPRDEFAVAAVGPWISLVCGAAFGLLGVFSEWLFPSGVAGPVTEVAGLLAWINVVLAGFNLIPGAPLDGGRVLRAGLWWLLKDRRRALRIAARAGQLLAIALLLGLALPSVRLGGLGGWFGGFIWLALGLFLWQAARTEIRQSDIDSLLDGRRARDLVGSLPEPVPLDQPLDLVDPSTEAPEHQLLPVVDDGHLVGVLAVKELRALHPADRSARNAGDLLRHVDHLPRVGLDDAVRDLIDAFAGRTDAVRLHDQGRDVAVVTEREVARVLARLRRGGASVPQPAPEAAA